MLIGFLFEWGHTVIEWGYRVIMGLYRAIEKKEGLQGLGYRL